MRKGEEDRRTGGEEERRGGEAIGAGEGMRGGDEERE